MSVMRLAFLGPGVGRFRVSEVGAMGLSNRHLCKSWNAVANLRSRMADESTELQPTVQELEKLVGDEFTSQKRKLSVFEHRLNKASKWIVSSGTGAVVLWRHDQSTLWAFVGAVISGVIAKALKHLINDKRPDSADGRKEDPGMPSSHAQGFMYLSTYASLALLSYQGSSLWTISSACALLLTGAYLSWLRVADGLHTVPQILVGGALGNAIASSWLWSWKEVVGPIIRSNPDAKYFIFAATAVAGLWVLLSTIRDWRLNQL